MRPMNIADRRRDSAWAMEEIEKSYHAAVSANGDDGFPYSVPMCVFRVGDTLCFHTALVGHLNTLLGADGRVCIMAVTKSAPDLENTTVRYRSAMAFGQARRVEDKAEKMAIAKAFFDKYMPGSPKEEYYVNRMSDVAAIWCVAVSEAVGKESLPGHNV